MHLLLGGALNKYWVMRMVDFYTTHNIKSMELRQNCQKKKLDSQQLIWNMVLTKWIQTAAEQGAEAGGWSDPVQQSCSGLQHSCGARATTDVGHQSSLCSIVEGSHHRCSLGSLGSLAFSISVLQVSIFQTEITELMSREILLKLQSVQGSSAMLTIKVGFIFYTPQIICCNCCLFELWTVVYSHLISANHCLLW